MVTEKFTNYAGLEVEEKKLQNSRFDGDASKLNVAYFSRRSKNIRHIVKYDKESKRDIKGFKNYFLKYIFRGFLK